MDRFRFRLWDNDNEVYDYIDFRDLSRINETLTTYEDYFYDGYFERNQDCIEQCTGLKDKNGNLIYEGDVIKTKNDCVYEIKWIGTGLVAFDGFCPQNIETLECPEIIGNIHEQKDNK